MRKINELRTITFSHDDKAENNLVHTSNRNTRSNVDIKMYFQYFFLNGLHTPTQMQPPAWVILDAIYQLKQWM